MLAFLTVAVLASHVDALQLSSVSYIGPFGLIGGNAARSVPIQDPLGAYGGVRRASRSASYPSEFAVGGRVSWSQLDAGANGLFDGGIKVGGRRTRRLALRDAHDWDGGRRLHLGHFGHHGRRGPWLLVVPRRIFW